MNFSVVFALFAIAMAGPVRYHRKPVQLYAQTGQYMAIKHSGIVKPIRGGHARTALINILPVHHGERGEFVIQGALTGLFIKIKKNGRLAAVPFRHQAAHFAEEMISENKFNSYRLVSKPNCRLTISKFKFKIQCHDQIKMKKMSFLPRRTHLRNRLLYRGVTV
mgnify:CR=1 FL=1